MSILSSIADIFTGGLAGGITGIIGSISSAVVNYKMKKLEYTHEKTMTELNMQRLKLETEMKIKLVESKVKGEVSLEEMKALKNSYKELDKTYFKESYMKYLPNWVNPIISIMFALLDFIRGIIRPLLTIFFTCLISWLVYNTYQTNPNSFVSSVELIVKAIIYLSVSIFSWWFCDRKIEKYLLGDKNV